MGLSVQVIAQESSRIILSSDVQWQLLNPARGDKSPRAGVLWGNIKSEEPTGFLVKFTDGFSSPPHIHNITYRAVVISGEIHNDDPTAAPMWMSPGSFWTQPKGETHITAARGKNSIALVEIDRGPYLVRPVDKEFDSGEKPINIDGEFKKKLTKVQKLKILRLKLERKNQVLVEKQIKALRLQNQVQLNKKLNQTL